MDKTVTATWPLLADLPVLAVRRYRVSKEQAEDLVLGAIRSGRVGVRVMRDARYHQLAAATLMAAELDLVAGTVREPKIGASITIANEDGEVETSLRLVTPAAELAEIDFAALNLYVRSVLEGGAEQSGFSDRGARRRGRRRFYEWDRAFFFLGQRLGAHGLPKKRSDLADELAEWFNLTRGVHPDMKDVNGCVDEACDLYAAASKP